MTSNYQLDYNCFSSDLLQESGFVFKGFGGEVGILYSGFAYHTIKEMANYLNWCLYLFCMLDVTILGFLLIIIGFLLVTLRFDPKIFSLKTRNDIIRLFVI